MELVTHREALPKLFVGFQSTAAGDEDFSADLYHVDRADSVWRRNHERITRAGWLQFKYWIIDSGSGIDAGAGIDARVRIRRRRHVECFIQSDVLVTAGFGRLPDGVGPSGDRALGRGSAR
jgi:hypothetical protein